MKGKVLWVWILSITATSPLWSQVRISGVVLNEQTLEPISLVNIGIVNKEVGTLSDPDGSFYIRVPKHLEGDTIVFSAIGYQTRRVPVLYLSTGREYEIKLDERPIQLPSIEVEGDKSFKHDRLGWMRGGEGTLPVAESEGGACATLLLEAPEAPFLIDKVYMHILYNTKDSVRFRLRLFDVDSATQQPGKDLMVKDVFVVGKKRIGWMNVDISEHHIEVPVKRFFLGFEWIEDRQTREALISSFQDWAQWKQEQFEAGDDKAIRDSVVVDGETTYYYRYRGNMIKWPGFDEMPPWTGLVVDDKKRPGNEQFVTYERKMSHGVWRRSESVLNAVVKISY